MTYVIIDGRGIIPDRVTKIDNSVFENCTRLETIVIPDSVIAIDEWAFRYCYSLQSITIVTQEKDPDQSRERIEYLLQSLFEYTKEFYLKVPIGCDDAYRHHPAFDGKFVEIIAANHVILLDSWWNPSIEKQAIDRAYRIGQTQDVTVIGMLAANTIE